MSDKSNIIDDHEFMWDPISAGRKFIHNTDITVGVVVISATKNTGPHDQTRRSSNCVCG